ncbi:MAG: hypothetical protein DRH70_02585 [Candidatus Coatesbacteria bacterium]|nr:MAG: hypothetical protein DRH70_02585 [Candidatus Coatesbacteria bacterium]
MTGLELFWTWVAAFLTLSIYSFLYKDNVFYKIAEHLVVGVSVGYIFTINWFQGLHPYLFHPLAKSGQEPINLLRLIPFFLGLLFLLRISRKYNWLSRFTIALVMGISCGVSIPYTIEARLIEQTKASMIDFTQQPSIWAGICSAIILVGTIATLVFFFFSKEHKGVLGGTARVGIVFIMVGFGASFGYTVMARVSLLIGRLNFLINDWAKGTYHFIFG